MKRNKNGKKTKNQTHSNSNAAVPVPFLQKKEKKNRNKPDMHTFTTLYFPKNVSANKQTTFQWMNFVKLCKKYVKKKIKSSNGWDARIVAILFEWLINYYIDIKYVIKKKN